MVTSRDRADVVIAVLLTLAVVAIAVAIAFDASTRLAGAAVSKAWLEEFKFRDLAERATGGSDGAT